MEETSLAAASFPIGIAGRSTSSSFSPTFCPPALEACIHPPFCITLQLYHLRHPHCQPRKPRAFIFSTTGTFLGMMMMLADIRERIRLREQVAQAACGTHGKFFGSHRPPFSPMIYIREYARRGARVCICEGEYADRTSRLSCIAAQIRLLSGRRALKAASPATPVHVAVHKPCM